MLLGTFLRFIKQSKGKDHCVHQLHGWMCKCAVKVIHVLGNIQDTILKHLQCIDHLVWEVNHNSQACAKLFGDAASAPSEALAKLSGNLVFAPDVVVAPIELITEQLLIFSQIPLDLELIIALDGSGGLSSKIEEAKDFEQVADDVIHLTTAAKYLLKLRDLVTLIAS